MTTNTQSDAELDTIFAADRVARAAAIWLRHQTAAGDVAPAGSRARREMSAGLVYRLAERLQLARSEALLAGYVLALLDAGGDMAMDVPLRMLRSTADSDDYAAGVAAAEELMHALLAGSDLGR
ncbi:MAG: hypothetical protein QNJ73_06565 [Gammaproteobacteria bacterium]|nr:hypothetical protein [Gammaproteobacteria bacterium]